MSICWECVLGILCVAAVILTGIFTISYYNDIWWQNEYKYRSECVTKGGSVIMIGEYKSMCLVK